MIDRRSRRTLARAFVVLAALSVVLATAAYAGGGKSDERGEGSFEALEAADQYAEARTSPADTVDVGAYTAAFSAAQALPVVGGTWDEVTTVPYDSDAHGYRDPVWSNSGGGAGIVSGRVTAIAADGDSLYVGTADGGVWKSTDGGTNWAPLLDDSPTLSIGAVQINPSDHSIWVGTGEANSSSDSYAGIGVLRSTDGGSTWTRVGGPELENHTTVRLLFDGTGTIWAATNKGLFRHSASSTTGAWDLALKPCVGQHDTTYISDIVARPGTNGNTLVAAIGWRGGSACNGFYLSTNHGASFARVPQTGAINDKQIGRVTLAYTPNGRKLIAIVQSSYLFNHTNGKGTMLMGVFSSTSGPAGPWSTIAESNKLADSGSALQSFRGYKPGVQAWYNQFLAIDPSNSNHMYLGLEEVFETLNGGTSWTTIGPYWNFGLPCAKRSVDNCPPTTHPDQHAITFANGHVYVGNDGGVYSRPINHANGWTNHNANLRTLQYYFAEVSQPAAGDTYWGGLQDNGVSLLTPGASTQVSPFGGDGGDGIVDPSNPDKAVQEYTSLDMNLTTNGGRSDGTNNAWREISPSCFAYTYVPSPCDPTPRFIAPFRADPKNLNHWVAGGEFVWDNQGKGWDTTCGPKACDWKIAYDTGPGRSITGLAVDGSTTYAGWCGPCNAPTFKSGIATNYGGTWHDVTASNLPNRFVNALIIDPANAAHVYAVYNGFSRRWTNDGGFGHVFESTNGGGSWTDISGNLPDIASDDLVLAGGNLILATDVGVYIAAAGGGAGTTWSRFGSGLPNSSVNDLYLAPDGSYVLASTHGRGLWKLAVP